VSNFVFLEVKCHRPKFSDRLQFSDKKKRGEGTASLPTCQVITDLCIGFKTVYALADRAKTCLFRGRDRRRVLPAGTFQKQNCTKFAAS